MRRKKPAPRLLAVALLALALLCGAMPTAGAITWYPRLCLGFSACESIGRGNAGYSKVYTTSHWGQYRNHNCTNYVAYRMIKAGVKQFITPGSGNATTWGAQARSKGVSVSKSNPVVGDIAWWDNTVMGSSGHVAYVEQVNTSAGTVLASQDSWQGDFSWRTYKISEVSGFIHTGNLAPLGAINSVSSTPGEVSVKGWALDKDAPTAALKVRVYIGGPSSTGERHDLVANVRRTDVAAKYPGTGNNHGFLATLSTELRGEQPVYIYAMNTPAGTNVLLGQRTVTIVDPDPIGTIETFATPPSQVRVAGWASDPNAPDDKLQIEVWVGGKKGSKGAVKATGTTGLPRSEVHANNVGVGPSSGFDITFVTSKIGRHHVYVYANNVGAGADALLGWTIVTVPPPAIFRTAKAHLEGTLKVGQKLTARDEFSAEASFAYRWYRDKKQITGETGKTYTLKPSDVGHKFLVKIVGSAPGHVTKTATSAESSTAQVGTFTISATPQLTGTAKVGSTLTVKTQAWTGSGRTLSVAWLRNGVRFATTSSTKHKLTSTDVGKKISAKVSYQRTGYRTVTKTSTSSAKVTPR